MRFTDNENTVSLSESFARCAIGRDRYLKPFLRFQLFLLASCSSLQLSSLGSDLHQPRDIIMETDMIYLNGTRGTECRWMEKGASQRGNPIHLDARVEGRKTPYTLTQTRPTALPDRDPNLPHCLTLGGLKGRRNVAPRATETHFCRDPTPRSPSFSSFSALPLPLTSHHSVLRYCSLLRKSISICRVATFYQKIVFQNFTFPMFKYHVIKRNIDLLILAFLSRWRIKILKEYSD